MPYSEYLATTSFGIALVTKCATSRCVHAPSLRQSRSSSSVICHDSGLGPLSEIERTPHFRPRHVRIDCPWLSVSREAVKRDNLLDFAFSRHFTIVVQALTVLPSHQRTSAVGTHRPPSSTASFVQRTTGLNTRSGVIVSYCN